MSPPHSPDCDVPAIRLPPVQRDFSLILVNWNHCELILACLASIERHCGHLDLEIWMVDNASSDASVAAVRKAYPHVRIIESKENMGFARGNNLAIRQAQGRYICLVNTDTELLGDCLSILKPYLKENPRVGLVAPRLLNRDLSIQDSCWRYPSLSRAAATSVGLHALLPCHSLFTRRYNLDVSAPMRVDMAIAAFWVVRREVVERIGLLDESFFFYGEDVDYCRRLAQAGWQVVYHPGAGVVHYGGQSSAKAPVRYAVELIRTRFQYWRKHHSRVSLAGFYSFQLVHHVVRLTVQGIRFLIGGNKNEALEHKLRENRACLNWLLSGLPNPLNYQVAPPVPVDGSATGGPQNGNSKKDFS
jgi:GT2 family glycosyltransferase